MRVAFLVLMLIAGCMTIPPARLATPAVAATVSPPCGTPVWTPSPGAIISANGMNSEFQHLESCAASSVPATPIAGNCITITGTAPAFTIAVPTGCIATVAPPPITTLPMYAYAAPAGSPCGVDGTDPGSTADKYLISGEETCSMADMNAGTSCTGATSTNRCQPFVYADLNLNYCQSGNTFPSLTEFTQALTDEHYFAHIFTGKTQNGVSGDGTITSTNRYTNNSAASLCGSHGGNANTSYEMNPGYATRISWEQTHLWSTSTGVMQPGWGVFSDDTPASNGQANDVNKFAEYGGGYWWQTGTDTNSVGYDYEIAMAAWVSGASPVPMGINCCGGGASIGKTVVNRNHVGGELSPSVFAAAYLDGVADIRDLCSSLTGGNLTYIVSERPVTTSGGFQPTEQTAATINGAIDLSNHPFDNCANTKFLMLNQPTAATTAASYLMALAGMVASRDGTDDEIVNWLYPIGCIASCNGSIVEFPYFWWETFVAFNDETPLTQVVFNGSSVPDSLTGCEGFSDKGGTVGLVAACPDTTHPVYVHQWGNCYINQVAQGNCAYILNTSTSAQTIVSGWFPASPANYNFVVTFSGDEVGGSVPYTGAPGNAISMATGCSNVTHCNQTYTWHGSALVLGTTTIAAQSGLLVVQ